MLVDDFRRSDFVSALGTRWRGVSGGVSEQSLNYDIIEHRHCLRLTGDVHLENNGGFVQMSLDLCPPDGVLDASDFTGIALTVYGNDQEYSLHLRTRDNVKPWQSYRAPFMAARRWQEFHLPFAGFRAHRLEKPLDLATLRRIGLVAIGRAFKADLAVAELCLY